MLMLYPIIKDYPLLVDSLKYNPLMVDLFYRDQEFRKRCFELHKKRGQAPLIPAASLNQLLNESKNDILDPGSQV